MQRSSQMETTYMMSLHMKTPMESEIFGEAKSNFLLAWFNMEKQSHQMHDSYEKQSDQMHDSYEKQFDREKQTVFLSANWTTFRGEHFSRERIWNNEYHW